MTQDEIKAIEQWLHTRKTQPQMCCFVGAKEAPDDTREAVFTCIHGKQLAWTEARRRLGLPV